MLRAAVTLAACCILSAACGGDDTSATPTSTSTGAGGGSSSTDGGMCGGPVTATAADSHCATDAGPRGEDVMPHDGSEADDDNCFMHVKMTAPCVQQNQDLTFTLTLNDLGTTTPSSGAEPEVEGIIGTHPLPNTDLTTTESNGVYTVGPVRFDQAGRWTLTFHFYDAMPAKHTHVSFLIDVP